MLKVQKYAVDSIERIQEAAERVRWTRQEGHEVVVVVSAMAGETDRLLRLAREVSDTPAAREVDMLLATGDIVAIVLMAMILQELGCPAISLTASQAGILTDNVHTRAHIKHISTKRLRSVLVSGRVPVVADFQGVNEAGDFTTMRCGGSDLAVALAEALQADRCEIYP